MDPHRDSDRRSSASHRISSLQPRAVGWDHVVLRLAGMVTLVTLVYLDPSAPALVAATTAVTALVAFRQR